MTQQFCDKIMTEITEHKVCPRPCWFYRAKKIAIWLTVSLLVFIIGWSISIDWYLLSSYDWEMARQTNIPLWRHAIIVLPYLWLIVATAALWLVINLTRKTEGGYRWPIVKALIVVFFIVGVIGFIGHVVRGDKIVHEQMMRSNFYRASVFTNDDLWSRPEWGVLSGTVVGHRPDGNLMIRDPKNRIWNVDPRQVQAFDGLPPEFKEGARFRVKGLKEETCSSAPVFRANWVRREE